MKHSTLLRLRPTLLGAVLVFPGAASAEGPECARFEEHPGVQPLSLHAGLAYGAHEGELFAVGSSTGCATCEVTAYGASYDACTDTWEEARIDVGLGWRLEGQNIHAFGHRVVAMNTALRFRPVCEGPRDDQLLKSDVRGFVYDLGSRTLSVIPPHPDEARCRDDVVDGATSAAGRYVVFSQLPRGDRARMFVYDIEAGRWAASFRAPIDLGELVSGPRGALWFTRQGKSDHWVYDLSTQRGSIREGGPPDTEQSGGMVGVRVVHGLAEGTLRFPLSEPVPDRYEAILHTRRGSTVDHSCDIAPGNCDPIMGPPRSVIEAHIQRVGYVPPPRSKPLVWRTYVLRSTASQARLGTKKIAANGKLPLERPKGELTLLRGDLEVRLRYETRGDVVLWTVYTKPMSVKVRIDSQNLGLTPARFTQAGRSVRIQFRDPRTGELFFVHLDQRD